MKYLGVGAGIDLSKSESQKLVELGECLALCGWQLRCGGRSEMEDKLLEGARLVSSIQPEVILPFPYYRHYGPASKGVKVFSSQPEKVQNQAMSMLNAPSELLSYRSLHQKVVLASGAALAFGCELKTPVRFAVTWIRNLDKRSFYRNQEAPIFHTLENRGIPVFNLGNPEHRARVENFISSTMQKAANF